jgi:hypothetical protein
VAAPLPLVLDVERHGRGDAQAFASDLNHESLAGFERVGEAADLVDELAA